MAVSRTKSVSGIHKLRHILFLYLQYALKHTSHLFLRGATSARYRHLYLRRQILVYRHRMLYGSSYRHTLCPAQFQHRLHILAKERSLNSYLVRQVFIYYSRHSGVYMSQFQVGVALLTHVDNTHSHHLGLLTHTPYHPISHHIGTGVDAHYDRLTLHLSRYGLLASSYPMLVGSP